MISNSGACDDHDTPGGLQSRILAGAESDSRGETRTGLRANDKRERMRGDVIPSLSICTGSGQVHPTRRDMIFTVQSRVHTSFGTKTPRRISSGSPVGVLCVRLARYAKRLGISSTEQPVYEGGR